MLYWVFSFSCLSTNYGFTHSLLPKFTYTGVLYLIGFGIANGPLGWAAMMLNNAMVFHSLEHMASLFIHAGPPVVTWTL